jgi:hypothetical protein
MVPMVDLSSSSDEKGLIPDTSWDDEFARRLFGNLNCSVLGPPGDGKVIILSDPDEDEEVCEEDATDAEAAPSSDVKSPAPTATDTTTIDNSHSPDQVIVIVAVAEMKPTHLRLSCQGGACKERALKNLRIMMVVHCYTTTSFIKKNGDGDAESLLSITPFMPPTTSFVFVMFLI